MASNPVVPIESYRSMEATPRAKVWLQPLDAPSILGRYGFGVMHGQWRRVS